MKNHMTTKMKKRIVKHIVQEGARFHVLRYDTEGVHCSEPDCETNKRNITPNPKTCEWRYVLGDDEFKYATLTISCVGRKDYIYLPDAWKFCTFCGKKIKVVG